MTLNSYATGNRISYHESKVLIMNDSVAIEGKFKKALQLKELLRKKYIMHISFERNLLSFFATSIPSKQD
jgi:hypothetical protein